MNRVPQGSIFLAMLSMASQISCSDINLKKVKIVLVCVGLCLVFGNAEDLSREEYLKLKMHLKLVNKPAVKSIKTSYGDIYDCVDIYKQPAFDHPLLKNHTLQMRPSSFPEELKTEASSDEGSKHAQMKLGDGGCPEGTVPIRRITMQDLRRAPHLYLSGKKYNTNETYAGKNDLSAGHNWANIQVRSPGKAFGTSVSINLWQPQVADMRMFSLAQFWLIGGPNNALNTIETGWMVNPDLYGDQRTRFFVYWTGDGYRNGCYNALCPGYVQLSREIPLGLAIEPISTYRGPQTEILLMVYKDPNNLYWWVVGREDKHVIGYFPTSLFPYLGDHGADRIDWGGETYNPAATGLPDPPMGSGHFSAEGYGAACYMKKLKVVNANNILKDAARAAKYLSKPRCYDVDSVYAYNDHDGRHFYFGGPGGRC